MRARLWFLVLGAVAIAGAGCSGRNLLNWKDPPLVTADERNPVVRIVALWEPSQGTGLDKLPTRGFAGQVLFFTRNSNVPVLVAGDVRVSLYDVLGDDNERAKPIHQFDFPGDAWKGHAVNGMLGPSYQLFVPYVRKHPYQVPCSLRVHLQPERGPEVYSELVHVTLPGPVRNTESEAVPPGANQPARTRLMDVKLEKPPEPELGATITSFRIPGDAPANADAPQPPPVDKTVAGPQPSIAAATDDVPADDPRKTFFERVNALDSRRATIASGLQYGGKTAAASDLQPLRAGFRLTSAAAPESPTPKEDLSRHPLATP